MYNFVSLRIYISYSFGVWICFRRGVLDTIPLHNSNHVNVVFSVYTLRPLLLFIHSWFRCERGRETLGASHIYDLTDKMRYTSQSAYTKGHMSLYSKHGRCIQSRAEPLPKIARRTLCSHRSNYVVTVSKVRVEKTWIGNSDYVFFFSLSPSPSFPVLFWFNVTLCCGGYAVFGHRVARIEFQPIFREASYFIAIVLWFQSSQCVSEKQKIPFAVAASTHESLPVVVRTKTATDSVLGWKSLNWFANIDTARLKRMLRFFSLLECRRHQTHTYDAIVQFGGININAIFHMDTFMERKKNKRQREQNIKRYGFSFAVFSLPAPNVSIRAKKLLLSFCLRPCRHVIPSLCYCFIV